MTAITSPERRRVLLLGAGLLALLTLPYLWGWASPPAGQHFTGHVIGVQDGYSYLGKMRLGVDGHWAFHIFYTDEPHQAAPLVFLPYILPGQALRLLTNTENPALYGMMITTFHLLRVIFGAALLWAIYRFVAYFIAGPNARLLAWGVASLGGGLGWLLLFWEAPPPEWYIPEAFTFHLLYALPHLALARAALLGGALALLAARHKRAYAVLAGALWTLAGLSVPFYLAVMYVILAVWGAGLWARARAFPTGAFVRALVAGGVTLPLFGYYLWAFSANPVFAQWSAQNLLAAPPPWHYALAYGPLVAFGAFGVRQAWRTEGGVLLLAWALVGLLLVYAPLNVQRRLGEGVLVVLATLAVMGLQAIVARWGPPARWLGAGLLALTLPASVMLYGVTFAGVATGSADLYVPAPLVEALARLDAQAPPTERGAVVLSRLETGNIVPAYTDLRTYVGHGPETLRYAEKSDTADAYFNDQLSAEARQDLYTTHNIRYVVFAPSDTPPPWAATELTPLFTLEDTSVFEVLPPPG